MKARESGGGCCSGKAKRSKSVKSDISVKKQLGTQGDIFNGGPPQ